MCTLDELKTIYTIDDLAEMNEAINLRGWAEQRLMKRNTSTGSPLASPGDTIIEV